MELGRGKAEEAMEGRRGAEKETETAIIKSATMDPGTRMLGMGKVEIRIKSTENGVGSTVIVTMNIDGIWGWVGE